MAAVHDPGDEDRRLACPEYDDGFLDALCALIEPQSSQGKGPVADAARRRLLDSYPRGLRC